MRDPAAVAEATARAQAVFHLAAQVAVTTSLVDPREDFAINIAGTLHLLDALRTRAPEVPIGFGRTGERSEKTPRTEPSLFGLCMRMSRRDWSSQ